MSDLQLPVVYDEVKADHVNIQGVLEEGGNVHGSVHGNVHGCKRISCQGN